MSRMGRLEFTTPREAWGGEAKDFTPLLAEDENLEYLGEETGIGSLTQVGVEYATAGDRRLDILAETADGRRVAIENQYGEADHDHLTRGLAYAVATDSAALIVVAENHKDEFVSVADYLNDLAGQSEEAGIRVWLVQVRAVRRIGDEIWSPEFVVRAAPNEWESTLRRQTAPVFTSLEDFYEKCRERTGTDWADKARTMIEDWLEHPMAVEHHGNQTMVALYHPVKRYPQGGINVVQLDVNGTVRICRGFIWKSSDIYDPDQPPEDLDQRIRATFPDAVWPDTGHMIKVFDARPDQVGQFADWLVPILVDSVGTSE